MSVYGIDHVIQECIEERLKVSSTSRGHTVGAKNEIYWESWMGLNEWIENQLRKRKGATVPNLGSFTWEQKGDMFRPIFLISESFVKEHNVRRQKIHKQPQVATCEDINYSKIAIKFTNSLTKDMVFAGVRDIVKKIGDFVDRVYEFEIEFAFGVLKSKERRVKFEFSQARLMKILPENIFFDEEVDAEVESSASPRGVLPSTLSKPVRRELNDSPSPTSTARSESVSPAPQPVMKKVPAITLDTLSINSNNNNNDNENQYKNTNQNQFQTNIFENISSKSTMSSTTPNPFGLTATAPPNTTIRPISPGLERVLLEMEKNASPTNKADRRRRAVEKVTEQAYLRCLENLGDRAKEEDTIRLKSYQLHKEWTEKERMRREKMHNDMQTLKDTLDSQVNAYHDRATQERVDRMNATVNCIIKESDHGNASSRLSTSRKAKREELANELMRQINHNADRRKNTRNQSLQEEREYLDHVAMELDMQYAAERAQHLEKQRTLLEAWEREGHIRNLKKLQSCGVNSISEYINRNLSLEELATGRSDRSVGFDIRKMK